MVFCKWFVVFFFWSQDLETFGFFLDVFAFEFARRFRVKFWRDRFGYKEDEKMFTSLIFQRFNFGIIYKTPEYKFFFTGKGSNTILNLKTSMRILNFSLPLLIDHNPNHKKPINCSSLSHLHNEMVTNLSLKSLNVLLTCLQRFSGFNVRSPQFSPYNET